jgi:hypothetical protein
MRTLVTPRELDYHTEIADDFKGVTVRRVEPETGAGGGPASLQRAQNSLRRLGVTELVEIEYNDYEKVEKFLKVCSARAALNLAEDAKTILGDRQIASIVHGETTSLLFRDINDGRKRRPRSVLNNIDTPVAEIINIDGIDSPMYYWDRFCIINNPASGKKRMAVLERCTFEGGMMRRPYLPSVQLAAGDMALRSGWSPGVVEDDDVMRDEDELLRLRNGLIRGITKHFA